MSGWGGAGGSFGGWGAGGGSFGGGSAAGGGGAFGGHGSGFVGSGGTFAAAGGSRGGKLRAWDPSVTGIACAQLRDAQWRAQGAVQALRSAPDLRVSAAPGVLAGDLRRCGDWLDECAATAQQLADDLGRLHDDTLLAGRCYEWASDAVRHLIEEVAGGGASALGAAVRAAAFAAAPWAIAIGLVAVPLAARLVLMHPPLLARITAQAQAAGVSIEAFLQQTSGFWERAGEVLMANPVFASALALAVESTDEALAGMLGIPAPMARELEAAVGDDEVFGLVTLAGAAGAGLLTGGGRVQAVFSRPVAPPAEPISDPAEAMRIIIEQDEQVTIYAFEMEDGSTRYQVFVRGTQTIAPSGSSGLDMRANLENAGSLDNVSGLDGQLHGSDAAVAEAMREAGIRPGDAVDMFGFSQGAGAVANVVASAEFDVETALLVGGPVRAAALTDGVTVFSIAHHGDVVPPLDGWADGEGVHTTMVESAGGHGTGPIARHSGLEYVDTLETVDDFVLQDYRSRLEAATAGGVGTAGVSVHLRRR
ncbi:hypothetical protein [Agrococcus sp. ARC_14]|uniref:hypothetical protein n=1 Tax=Agrococcus sp. ARC_14 TaxID=2919927 RepID=UPI001F0682E0|nr:hypothetical protein [Agrococcus sp. ARC_14]MCH1881556.1 hypothetical protein [Agrococcus sp. ARC_14]